MSEEKGALTKISSLDGLVSALKSGLYQEALSQSYNLKYFEAKYIQFASFSKFLRGLPKNSLVGNLRKLMQMSELQQ